MEPEIYKYRLRKYQEIILKDLEPNKVLGYLFQDEIFDEDDMDEVRSERTRKKKAIQLLALLGRRDVNGYTSLVNAFENTQPHLARLMKTPVPGENNVNEKPQRLAGSKPSEQHSSSIDDLTRMINYLGNEPVEQLETTIMSNTNQGGSPYHSPFQTSSSGIMPTNFEMIGQLYRPHLLDSVYKMTSSPRGLAVIINIENFKPDPSKHCKHEEKLDYREGSYVDAQGLEKLFRGLDFQVILKEDKKEDELRKELQAIAKSTLKMYDCFVMCIMSHGKDDFFYCHDGGRIKISEIQKMFNNCECPALCQKPKLFFIQACRGKTKDTGRTVSDAPSEHSQEEKENMTDQPLFKFKDDQTPKGPTISENADILLAYSCVDGYPSYRNTATGSRYLRSLINVFKDYAGIEDVESMMTRVINKVNSEGAIGDKQVPKPETTLTKKVFFWPGIKEFHV